MSKKVYISGNTANCFNEFTLCCTKDFENKFLTNNSSIVDNEEYFYADFESVENIESYYENRIIKLQDEITDLQHRLDVAEKALELAVNNISWCPAKQGEFPTMLIVWSVGLIAELIAFIVLKAKIRQNCPKESKTEQVIEENGKERDNG